MKPGMISYLFLLYLTAFAGRAEEKQAPGLPANASKVFEGHLIKHGLSKFGITTGY